LIFNHKRFTENLGFGERVGTEVDCANLTNMFQRYNFVVKQHDDFALKRIVRFLNRYATSHSIQDHLLLERRNMESEFRG